MDAPFKPFLESIHPLISMRPMLMLTGFLGAGKTTLLRSILNDLTLREHPADVILNDRENARLDRETLRDHAASVAALTGSCVCCEGLDELCDMILKASKSKHSVLLIELNGTADPVPLQESFTLLESKFLLHPRWQVCVIDARHFGKRGHYHELEKLQLETASHYYISHLTDLSTDEKRELTEAVKAINPRASEATASSLAEGLSEAIQKNRGHARRVQPAKTGNDFSIHSSSLPKPHLHDRHALAHEFTGCNIVFPTAVKVSNVTPWLEQLPESVMRMKALLTLISEPDCRYLYERVGKEISPNAIPVRHIDKVPCSGLFIGPDLDPDQILKLTREILHPACHFATS